jgi:hypothetical protein
METVIGGYTTNSVDSTVQIHRKDVCPNGCKEQGVTNQLIARITALEAENAALKQDAEVLRKHIGELASWVGTAQHVAYMHNWNHPICETLGFPGAEKVVHAALDAAGLLPKEEVKE